MTAAPLCGDWFKLEAEDGTYAGLLMLPRGMVWMLGRYHSALGRRVQGLLKVVYDVNASQSAVEVSQFEVATGCSIPGAVRLYGIAPEELATEPGFAFLPAYGWTPKPAPEANRREVAPGAYLAAAREVAGV